MILVVPVLAKANVESRGDVVEFGLVDSLLEVDVDVDDNLDRSHILQLPSREDVRTLTRGNLPNEIEREVMGSVWSARDVYGVIGVRVLPPDARTLFECEQIQNGKKEESVRYDIFHLKREEPPT